MKKINKKVTVILGTVVLALGVLAIPALAETTTQTPMGIMGKMQSFMNSETMQEAMTTGDVNKMAEAMNTPEMQEIMGEEHINQMTEVMKNGNMQSMHGQGGMMSGTAGNMMGGFTSQQ